MLQVKAVTDCIFIFLLLSKTYGYINKVYWNVLKQKWL